MLGSRCSADPGSSAALIGAEPGSAEPPGPAELAEVALPSTTAAAWPVSSSVTSTRALTLACEGTAELVA